MRRLGHVRPRMAKNLLENVAEMSPLKSMQSCFVALYIVKKSEREL